MKFKILSSEDKKTVEELNEHQIAAFCVELHGGGHNEQQVSNAMVLNSRICTLPDQSSITEKKFTITRTE